MCDEKDFKLILRKTPPEDLVEGSYDDIDPPSHLSENLTEGEFYVIKTTKGDTIQGFLFNLDGISIEMQNCYKLNPATSKWERVGNNKEFAQYWINIPTDEITEIKPAPYTMKDPSDYGFKPFPDKKSKS